MINAVSLTESKNMKNKQTKYLAKIKEKNMMGLDILLLEVSYREKCEPEIYIENLLGFLEYVISIEEYDVDIDSYSFIERNRNDCINDEVTRCSVSIMFDRHLGVDLSKMIKQFQSYFCAEEDADIFLKGL